MLWAQLIVPVRPQRWTFTSWLTSLALTLRICHAYNTDVDWKLLWPFNRFCCTQQKRSPSAACYQCTLVLNIIWCVWYLPYLSAFNDQRPYMILDMRYSRSFIRRDVTGALLDNGWMIGYLYRCRPSCRSHHGVFLPASQAHDSNHLTPNGIKWHTSSVTAFIWGTPLVGRVNYWLVLCFDVCNHNELRGTRCVWPTVRNKQFNRSQRSALMLKTLTLNLEENWKKKWHWHKNAC